MTEAIQILRYHVDPESRQIVVQCRRYDEVTGSYLPLAPNMIRHVMPANLDLLDAIERDVRPMLERDLGELTDAHPAAVTSALHQIREARTEQASARIEAAEIRERHEKTVREAEAELAAAKAVAEASRAAAALETALADKAKKEREEHEAAALAAQERAAFELAQTENAKREREEHEAAVSAARVEVEALDKAKKHV